MNWPTGPDDVLLPARLALQEQMIHYGPWIGKARQLGVSAKFLAHRQRRQENSTRFALF